MMNVKMQLEGQEEFSKNRSLIIDIPNKENYQDVIAPFQRNRHSHMIIFTKTE